MKEGKALLRKGARLSLLCYYKIAGGICLKKISLFYNPYLKSTRLIVNGVEHGFSGHKLDEFIVGQDLTSWLSPYSISYRKWNGVLPELIEQLNDDEISLSIYTSQEMFEPIKQEIEIQSFMIEESGYDSSGWELKMIDYYDEQTLIKNLAMFIQRERHYLPQYGMNICEYIESDLNTLNKPSVLEIQNMYRELKKAIRYAKDEDLRNCKDKKVLHWEKAEKELWKIFGGKSGYEC